MLLVLVNNYHKQRYREVTIAVENLAMCVMEVMVVAKIFIVLDRMVVMVTIVIMKVVLRVLVLLKGGGVG